MWRRVVDQTLFHLANGRQSIVIYGLFVGSTDLPFSKTSISKAWPALVGSKHHRGSAVVCAGADALHVSSKVDGRSVIFAFRYLNGTTFRRIILVILLPSGLLILASSFVELLKRFKGRTAKPCKLQRWRILCAVSAVVNCTRCRQAKMSRWAQ
jgi:hypothetical protein